MTTGTHADVSVVICCYTHDRWDDLNEAINSVLGQDPAPKEVIVVVDHNPSLLSRVENAFPGIIVIGNSGEPGLSDARNSGVRAATGTIVAFIDDDAVADAGWLERLVKVYSDPSVAGVGGAVRPEWGTGRPRWFPEEFDWVVGCSYRGMPKAASPVRNLLGCNMSFRRAAFQLAGGFDTRVGRVGNRPIGCEETEFCIRLSRTLPGILLVYEPAATVRHRVPPARARWKYFRARCYSEGLSKAVVAQLAGSRVALQSERQYALQVLPRAILDAVVDAVQHRDPWCLARAFAVIVGLAITTAGYATARVSARRTIAARSGTRNPASLSGLDDYS